MRLLRSNDRFMKKLFYPLLALALSLGAASCKKNEPETPTEQTQSKALTAGSWVTETLNSDGTNRERATFTFRPNGTYTLHYLRQDSSPEHKDDLLSEFNDEFTGSGRYIVDGTYVKLIDFTFGGYAVRFKEHRANPSRIDYSGLFFIFDEQAQTLKVSALHSPEGLVDEELVFQHKF